MQQPKNTTYGDRASASADAKKAMLAKFQAKPAVKAAETLDRNARLQAERDAIRAQRQAEKDAIRAEKEAVEAEARRVRMEAEAADLEARRGARKERKVLERSEAQSRRASRLAAFMR